MRKKLFIPAVLAALLLTACSDASAGSSEAEKDPSAWQNKTAFSSAGGAIASVMADIEKEMYSCFDRAVYGGMVKAFGSEQLKGCSISDIDGDGCLDLAVRAFFNGNTSDSYAVARNEPSLGIYYNPGVYDGDVSRDLKYDSADQRILFNIQSTAPEEKYDKYFTLSEDGWALNSIMTGDASEDSGKKSCIVKDDYASKDEFVKYTAALTDLEGCGDVFNVCLDRDISETAAVFMRYLRRNYSPTMTSFKDDDGRNICLICVPDLIDTYRVSPFFEGEKTKDPRDGFIKTILAAKTACFVLDEIDSGTRIRCQLYGSSVTFNIINGKLTQVSGSSSKEVQVSAAAATIDGNIIS